MSETYYIDRNREKEIAKKVCRTTKRWKVCHVIIALFIVMAAVSISLIILYSGECGASLVGLIIFALLVPTIGVFISAAVARTGGRDILLARDGETITLEDDALVETYMPRFHNGYFQINAAFAVENRIRYEDISTVAEEPNACRHVVTGKITTSKHFDPPLGLVQEQNKQIVLYDYFMNGEMMLKHLNERIRQAKEAQSDTPHAAIAADSSGG